MKAPTNHDDILAHIRAFSYIDLRFTDPRGGSHHITYPTTQIESVLQDNGVLFDGSSIKGWKSIHESDMLLIPDFSTLTKDPFYAMPTGVVFCDIFDPYTNEPYACDPRRTATAAEKYLVKTGIADTAYFGPEAEFFVFDDVRWRVDPFASSYTLNSMEGRNNTDKAYASGNPGHRPPFKGGYMPVPPVDQGQDMRSEMLSLLGEMGVRTEKHHHEVGAAQHELGIRYSTLREIADHLQLYKYVIWQVAASYGKTATFMPKPLAGDNGSGMHVHQSLWNNNKALFSGDSYAGHSETCLYYMGGIFKHARAISAFSNPTTNSYKRLVPGFEAPVLLAYSARNRSAAIRIPTVSDPSAKRIEARFPDACANPYLAFSAMLMAGIDGIENKIHPGEPMEEDLYALPLVRQQEIGSLSPSLKDAMLALDADRDFLTRGGVFTDFQIDSYIDLKEEEINRLRKLPHPVEFDMYYSA